jgi:hypothetical protein
VRQDERVISASDLPRRLVAEFLGSALLAAIVIGSGIAAQRLSPSDTGLELLENSAATAVGLFAIILMFGPPTSSSPRGQQWAGRCGRRAARPASNSRIAGNRK